MRLLLAALFAVAAAAAQAQAPAGHAHNDYEHERPLIDALAFGFASVEADIWLKDGQLLVGHDEADLDPARALQRLYLDPLTEAAAGRSADAPLILLIDIKSDGGATYRALSDVLAGYAKTLARIEDGSFVPGPVMAIVSGNRPRETMVAETTRYAFYDGRLGDIGSGLDSRFMPLVSDNWTRHFSWKGDGEMPTNEREKLAAIVAKAHEAGYRIRFWATPDAPGAARDAVWRVLAEVGADFINTDDLSGFAEFSASLTKQ